jgi:hypothetical protein
MTRTQPHSVSSVPARPVKPLVSVSLLLAVLLAWLLLHGIGLNDFRDFKAITSDLSRVQVEPKDQFLYSSPLMLWAGALLRPFFGAALSYVLLCATGLGLLAFTLWRHLREQFDGEAGLALVFLMWSPLLIVLLHWVGKSDPYLLVFYLLLRSSRSSLRTSLCCFLMLLCHREMGTLLVVFECLRQPALRWRALPGLLLGHAAIYGYHHLVMAAPPMGRADFLGADALLIPRTNAHHVLGFVGLSLAWYWAFVMRFSRLKPTEGLILLACLGFSLLTLDYTRVFTLLAFPVLLSTLERGFPLASEWAHRSGKLMAMLLVLMSAQMVNGELAVSKIPENIAQAGIGKAH